jgi:hypothetical protein
MQHETLASPSGAEPAERAGHSSATEPGERPEASSLPGEDGADPAGTGPVPTFLVEIARTMQATADRERERIAAAIADRLRAHVEMVRSRASAEAEELKRLAEEDVDRIHEWSAIEAERLRRETESRIGARRQDLERHLLQHDALIEREISRTREVVDAYQADLDRFVGRLTAEREPTEIARLASLLPEPPRVEEIGSAARAEAIAELSGSEGAIGIASADAADGFSRQPSTTERGFGLVGVMDSSVVGHQAGPAGQENAPAETAVGFEEEHGDDEPQRQILGARNRADLAKRLAPVVVIAVIMAILALLVMTGQVHAGSSRSLAPGI